MNPQDEKNHLQILIDLIKENDLLEITYKFGQVEYSIKAKNPVYGAIPPQNIPAQTVVTAPTVQPVAASSGNQVKAPIIGTFYAAPAPDKPPFVEIGKEVKKGDVLMIIESMKLMNEVTSEFDGTVKEILVKDGDAVEFDQVLMIIQ